MEIISEVTPSLHPHNIEAIDGYNDDTRLYVAPALESFSTAYESLGAVHKARVELEKNAALTIENRQLMVADFSDKHLTVISKKFDSAISNITKSIDSMETMLTTPLELGAERSVIATEIRAHVKSMSVADRFKFLNDALDAGDHTTLKAVLGAPSYLSGMAEEERKFRTRAYHEKHSPEVAKRLQVMRTAKQMMEDRGGLVITEIQKAIGTSREKINTLRQARGRTEAALKFVSQ